MGDFRILSFALQVRFLQTLAYQGQMSKTVKFEGQFLLQQTTSQQTVVPGVGMTCEGCSGAIERILKKVDSNLNGHFHRTRMPSRLRGGWSFETWQQTRSPLPETVSEQDDISTQRQAAMLFLLQH